MKKSALKLQSPLILTKSKVSQKAKKEQARAKEYIDDFHHLLKNFLHALTDAVDEVFPNADFLHREQVPGSAVLKDSKLSSVVLMATCANTRLTGLKPAKDIVENYSKTLENYLRNLNYDSEKKARYNSLFNTKDLAGETYNSLIKIIKTFKQLSNAMDQHQEIREELSRLEQLDITSKTIDRYLLDMNGMGRWQETIAKLMNQTKQLIRSNEKFQGNDALVGAINSLVSFANLIATKATKSAKQNRTSPESRQNGFRFCNESAKINTNSLFSPQTTTKHEDEKLEIHQPKAAPAG